MSQSIAIAASTQETATDGLGQVPLPEPHNLTIDRFHQSCRDQLARLSVAQPVRARGHLLVVMSGRGPEKLGARSTQVLLVYRTPKMPFFYCF